MPAATGRFVAKGAKLCVGAERHVVTNLAKLSAAKTIASPPQIRIGAVRRGS